MNCPIVPTIECQLNCPYRECKKLITAEEMRLSEALDNEMAPKPLPNDYRSRWARNNPERNKANKHRHYIENYDIYKARRESYYQENKENILNKQREYYQRNKELLNASVRDKKRERWAENPEHYRQKQRDYRARKKAEKMAEIGV